jgi:hypothetical protein
LKKLLDGSPSWTYGDWAAQPKKKQDNRIANVTILGRRVPLFMASSLFWFLLLLLLFKSNNNKNGFDIDIAADKNADTDDAGL